MRFSDFSELLAGISGKRSGERTSFSSILSVLGGVRGVVESLFPPLVYILTFSILKDLLLACVISVLLSLFIVSLRIAKRQSLVPAFSGFLGLSFLFLFRYIQDGLLMFLLSVLSGMRF